jgi:hypothetical protein
MLRSFRTSSSGAAANLGVCILAGCALIAAATWASGDSTPRRPARGTHVGVAPSDLVVLSVTGGYSAQKFVRVREDGTTDTAEFAVPSGHRLVVTEVDWCGAGITSPRLMLRVFVENKTTSTTRSLVYSAFAWVGAYTGSGGTEYGGVNSGIVTGFSVGPTGRLVCDVVGNSQPTVALTVTGTVNPTVILRGYLVSEE